MTSSFQQYCLNAWYGNKRWPVVLQPLASGLQCIATERRKRLQANAEILPVPVIVVGNISLGGTGKTPLLASLARLLLENGYQPGIVSRGYGGDAAAYPLDVTPQTPVSQSGDEPALLSHITACPVVVDPVRVRAARHLIEQHQCNVILSDDGLQHYALARDIEIAVVDGSRGLGNGRCLPAGPLREPPVRLTEVDWVIVNGELCAKGGVPESALTMHLEPCEWRRVDGSGEAVSLQAAPFGNDQPLHAVAGIGNPERFFSTLETLGYTPCKHPFADHHRFAAADFTFAQGADAVLMTAKDAVKCQGFAQPNWWYLTVEAVLPEVLNLGILSVLNDLKLNKNKKL